MARLALVVAVLLAFPLFSGCVGSGGVGPYLFRFDPIERRDPIPEPAKSCGALLDRLNEMALNEARVSLDRRLRGLEEAAIGATGTKAAASGSTAGTASADSEASGPPLYTGTNNQEIEADEADLVKTDGRWTYIVVGDRLHILSMPRVGEIEERTNVSLGLWGAQVLLIKAAKPGTADRLVVLGRGEPPQAIQDARERHVYGMTRILVLDLADRRAPTTVSDTWVEGSVAAARLVDGIVHVVIHRHADALGLTRYASPTDDELAAEGLTRQAYYQAPPDVRLDLMVKATKRVDRENVAKIADARIEEHLPVVAQTSGATTLVQRVDNTVCRGVLVAPQSVGRSIVSIVSLDPAAKEVPVRMVEIASGRPIVYASGSSLVLAAPSEESWWLYAQPELDAATDLHWFDLKGLTVTWKASGRVVGSVLDSFSLDVQDDRLRVVTTTGLWSRGFASDPTNLASQVVVLRAAGAALIPEGTVTGLAPGERVWSARFTPERVYIVTFRNIDPLWVIDLTGTVPRILGEAEIPGVSTYIHPLDDRTLLTIGYGPGPDGLGLDWSSPQLSVFDISDPARPTQKQVLLLAPGDTYAYSGAVGEHKAFTYWPQLGALAVPVTVHAEGGSQALVRLVDVDVQKQSMTLRGDVDHSGSLGHAVYPAGVDRTFFLGHPGSGPVSLYATSAHGVAVHDWESLALQDTVLFPAYGYSACDCAVEG